MSKPSVVQKTERSVTVLGQSARGEWPVPPPPALSVSVSLARGLYYLVARLDSGLDSTGFGRPRLGRRKHLPDCGVVSVHHLKQNIW